MKKKYLWMLIAMRPTARCADTFLIQSEKKGMNLDEAVRDLFKADPEATEWLMKDKDVTWELVAVDPKTALNID